MSTIDDKTNQLWKLISEIALIDKEFAKQLINIQSAPCWLQIELED